MGIMKLGCLCLAALLLLSGCADGGKSGSAASSAAGSTGAASTQANRAGGERAVVVNPGEWELPGTLSLPAGDGPFPLVVFVHGSGPSDRDETMGRQTLFKDLATDLAARGVASIRYDKRTYVHTQKMAADTTLTVKEETIDDALYAVALARTFDDIDADSVFIAGHSMGGYLIPRIHEADAGDQVAGYISLAGSVRPIMELTLEQIDYLLPLEKDLSDADKAATRQAYADADAAIKALTDADRGSAKAIMGAYPSYWLDLAGYRPADMVAAIDKPLLFLQGGHDYQVPLTDFQLWQTALQGRENAVFKLYDDLTHSFVKTDAMSTPADYDTAASVDKAVAADIAAFIG